MLSHHSVLKVFALGLLLSTTCGHASAQQLDRLNPIPRVRQFLQQSNPDDVRRNELLGIPSSHCGHVVDLMMKNRMRARFRTNGIEQLHLPHLTVGLQPGDLEFLCVHLVQEGNAQQGPVFQVGMKNNSDVPIGNFKVSLVGVLGQIHVHSPSATICIPRMEAGQEMQIQIQLPVACLSMGPLHQQCCFDTLVVALDSYDELLECDELNNVQILARQEVGLLVSEPAQPASGPTPLQPVAPAPVPSTPLEKTSPLDGLDLDQLNLEGGPDESEVQSLLFRR